MTFIDKQDENLIYQDTAPNPDGVPFDPPGKDFSNAWVYAWNGGDGHRWSSVTSAVTSATNSFIGIKACGLGSRPDSFLVEGSLDLLTRPGEFFYDKSAGKLYYASRFNGSIEQHEIIVPKLVRILDITGSSASSPAQNILFSALTFKGTDRIAPSGTDDWTDASQSSWDAAIHVKNAKAIMFDKCKIADNYTDLSNMDHPPTAVYNDRDAINTIWSNVDAGDSQMFTFRHDPQKTGSLTFNNVSWDPKCNPRKNEVAGPANPNFDKSKMGYDKIGLTADFPAEYNDLAARPVAPLNLWAETGNGEMRLHWTQADRATSYTVKRADSADGLYTNVATVPVPATGWDNGTTYTDANLTNGKSSYYVVTALDADGESAPTLPLSATPSIDGSNKLTGTPIGVGDNFAKAFDGDLKSYYDNANGWVGLDLGRPFVIAEVRYAPRNDNTGTTAKMHDGEFQGSNDADFSNPVTLYKVLATKGGAGTPVLIPQSIYNSTGFRYVRYVGPKSSTLIAEMEFHGHPAPSK